MGFAINRYWAELPQHGVLRDGFTPDEVEKIVFLEKLIQFQQGMVGGGGTNQSTDLKARNSDIAFIQPDENGLWIFERLARIVPKVNYDLFMLEIQGIEAIQYTKYNGDEEQFYDWHLDTHAHWLEFERKISGTVMLSDPDEYEGGELEIITDGSPDRAQVLKPKIGEIAFFASNMPHRVRPVTKGIRRSLVFWVEGRRTM